MDFTTVTFLGFLFAVAAVYRICPVRLRPALLALASYAFYWRASGTLTILLAAATLAVYIGARRIESSASQTVKRVWVALLAGGLVAMLIVFKSAILQSLLDRDLLLPLGVSYYTFKLTGYVLDVYWAKAAAERNLAAFAAYVAFFPQIVAGPIQRSEDFLKQVSTAPAPGLTGIAWGIQRILLGYFKKFVVADSLAVLVNYIYGQVYGTGTPVLLAYYLYPLQVFADFSGLTDIAVGSAALLGIRSPENFAAPFAAATPSEYWRRWHITLTTWLRDYVFLPLRMAMRNWGNVGLVASLFINMVLIGVWHGFRWTFVMFGIVHAVYLTVDALTLRARSRFYKLHPAFERFTDYAGPVVVFHLVALAFVFFRADEVGQAFYLLGHLWQGLLTPSAEFLAFLSMAGRGVLVGCVGYVLMELADYLRRHSEFGERVVALPRWRRWSLYSCTASMFLAAIVLLLSNTADRTPFLYAIF